MDSITVEFIITWLGLGITIGGFIWKAALMSARIEKLEESKKEISGQLERITIRNENEVNKLQAEIKELNIGQARIEEKINMILNLIKDNKGTK